MLHQEKGNQNVNDFLQEKSTSFIRLYFLQKYLIVSKKNLLTKLNTEKLFNFVGSIFMEGFNFTGSWERKFVHVYSHISTEGNMTFLP